MGRTESVESFPSQGTLGKCHLIFNKIYLGRESMGVNPATRSLAREKEKLLELGGWARRFTAGVGMASGAQCCYLGPSPSAETAKLRAAKSTRPAGVETLVGWWWWRQERTCS